MCFGRRSGYLNDARESLDCGCNGAGSAWGLPFLRVDSGGRRCFERSGSLACIVKIALTQTSPIARSRNSRRGSGITESVAHELSHPVVRTCAGRTAIRTIFPYVALRTL